MIICIDYFINALITSTAETRKINSLNCVVNESMLIFTFTLILW